MINSKMILLRERNLLRNDKNNQQNINLNMLSESFIRNGNNADLKKILSNYKNISYNTSYTMDKIGNILNEFAKNNNSSKIESINKMINEEFLPYIPHKVIQEFMNSVPDDYNKELFMETANDLKICDRVISNNKKLSSTSNFIKYFNENNINEDNQMETVMDICSIVDKYNMNQAIKMNVAIENGLHNLGMNMKDLNRSEALLTMYEYFALNKYDTDKFVQLVTESKMLTEQEKDIVLEFKNSPFDKLLDDIANSKKQDKSIEGRVKLAIKTIFSKSEKEILEDMPNLFAILRGIIYGVLIAWGGPIGIIVSILSIMTDRIISTGLSRKTVAKFIAKYKQEEDKLSKMINNNKLSEAKRNNLSKTLKEVNKNRVKLELYEDSLYSEKENEKRMNDNNEENIDESADVVLGSKANEYIQKQIYRIPVSTEDYLKDMHTQTVIQVSKALTTLTAVLERKYKDLLKDDVIQLMQPTEFRQFEVANINTINRYISVDAEINVQIATFLPLNLKDSNDQKVRDYLEDLCDTIQSILDADYCILFEGDSQMYKIYVAFNQQLYIDNSKDEEIQQESVHISLEKDLNTFLVLDRELERLDENSIITLLSENINKINPQLLVEYCKFANEDMFVNNDDILNILSEHKMSIYDSKEMKINGYNKYYTIDYLNDAIHALKEGANKNIEVTNLCEYTNRLLYHNDSYNTLLESMQQNILETSFINSLKMAKQRLATKAKTLSDKEKAISTQLDSQLEKLNDSIQKSTIERSREKIIKGNVLPSASTIIKTAIIAGAAFAINPALAVVGALGSLALSKHISKTQKQYILDEIDVNLKMVEKKIQLAESNNDMKSLEQLMKLEKKLKRERQRIFYNMKSYYNDINRD